MKGFARSFRDLDVYRSALESAVEIHAFCRSLPDIERYVLADQMRRSSRSVNANISESWRKRRYKAAFIAKLSDAETEAAETQSWLDVALKFGYMRQEEYERYDANYETIISQLVKMIDEADKWCTL